MHKDISKNGYRLIKSYLDPNKLFSIRNDATYIFNKQIQRLNINEGNFELNLIKLFQTNPETVKNCGRVVQNLQSLYSLCTSLSIMSIIERDFDIKLPVINTKPVLYFMNKNLSEDKFSYNIPAHRDYGSTQGSLNSCVLWAPICSTKSVGSLQVIPGSHLLPTKLKEINHSFALEDNCNDSDFISIDMEIGDVLLFSTNLIHRSGENTTDSQLRWSISFRYSDAMCNNWIDRKYIVPYSYKATTTDPYVPEQSEMEEIYGHNTYS